MGYRSDVYLKTTKDGYKALREEIKKNEMGYELWTSTDKLVYNKIDGTISMEWNYLKWYPEYEDVSAIEDAIDTMCDKYPIHFVRIGESLDDIEDKYYDPDVSDVDYLEPLDIERVVYLQGDPIDEEDI